MDILSDILHVAGLRRRLLDLHAEARAAKKAAREAKKAEKPVKASKDKAKADKDQMTNKENYYLAKR